MTPAADTLLIRTPEGVEFALPLAGPFSRMLAYSVDLMAITAAGTLLSRLLGPLQFFGPDTIQAVEVVLSFALFLGYSMVLEWAWRGQTLGKRLVGLRVVEATGLRLEPSQVIVRNVMRFVDALPALYLLGALSCVISRRRQRLGDLVAGTVVIRTSRLKEPDLDQIRSSKYNSLADQRHLAARLRQKVSPEIAKVALEALLRRSELDAASRLQMFHQLAQYFRGLVAYPAEIVEQLSDEQYVRGVVEVVFTRQTALARNP